jgi:hypothetical protein
MTSKSLLAMALSFFFLSVSFSLAVEKAQPVTVTAKVLKSKIKIGDEIRLLVQVEHPRKFSVNPPSDKINLLPFEIKKVDAQPLRKGQNRVQVIYGLTLTVFEVGDLKISAFPVRYQDESGKPGEVWTDPVPVTVLSVGKKLTDKDDIRPIKGPVSISLLYFWNWILGILAALLAAFLTVKVVRRWLRNKRDLEALKPPHVRVKIELERLKNQGLLEEKKIKEYYSALAEISRNYIDRVGWVEAHEHTTVEILELLKERNLEKTVIEKIKIVLEETDLVKFAKVIPERTLADRLEKEILDIVELTKPSEENVSLRGTK